MTVAQFSDLCLQEVLYEPPHKILKVIQGSPYNYQYIFADFIAFSFFFLILKPRVISGGSFRGKSVSWWETHSCWEHWTWYQLPTIHGSDLYKQQEIHSLLIIIIYAQHQPYANPTTADSSPSHHIACRTSCCYCFCFSFHCLSLFAFSVPNVTLSHLWNGGVFFFIYLFI